MDAPSLAGMGSSKLPPVVKSADFFGGASNNSVTPLSTIKSLGSNPTPTTGPGTYKRPETPGMPTSPARRFLG